MLNHMTMPVLFAVLIAVLAIISAGVFIAFRIIGERVRASDEAPPQPSTRP